ncbi:MAG: hypothetical protein DHS20C09_11940 [marine bacterium B5-7]|nr:MAG: hypothetical protein DHS20C09_11940 [marine bacterium B5-7]
MIAFIDLVMKGIFFIMMVSALFYFGYAVAVPKSKSLEFQGIWSNKQLKIVAARCFEGRQVNQFVTIVKVFKSSFLALILLMVLHGVLGQFT